MFLILLLIGIVVIGLAVFIFYLTIRSTIAFKRGEISGKRSMTIILIVLDYAMSIVLLALGILCLLMLN